MLPGKNYHQREKESDRVLHAGECWEKRAVRVTCARYPVALRSINAQGHNTARNLCLSLKNLYSSFAYCCIHFTPKLLSLPAVKKIEGVGLNFAKDLIWCSHSNSYICFNFDLLL